MGCLGDRQDRDPDCDRGGLVKKLVWIFNAPGYVE